MSASYSIAGESFNLLCCGKCGIRWLTPSRFDDEKRESGGNFYCPNGHCRVYSVSENERLTQERNRLLQEQARLIEERNAAHMEAAKAARALTRHKKRAANGTCPCCKRTFTQIALHMKHKHPDFVQTANVVPMKGNVA